MSDNLTNAFVGELFSLCKKQTHTSLIHQAKRCLLDYLGSAIVGSFILKDKIDVISSHLTSTDSSCTIIGSDKRSCLFNTAFINGLIGHVAEMDDGVRFGMLHPGAPLFSALLPVAEVENVSSENLFKGILIGYEAAVRLAMAIQPAHYEQGFHPTATCGSVGAAIGIAAMLDFTEEEMKNAFSASVITAGGSLKILEDGSDLKPMNVGHAAKNAIAAVTMARSGFKGPDDALSGNTGFLPMFAGNYNESALFRKEDDPMCIELVYTKPYAACRHAHAPIEATLKIREKHNIHVDDVQKLQVLTYQTVIGRHDHRIIKGVLSAKMSIPYSVSVALVRGKAGIAEFTEDTVSDQKIISLASKIDVAAEKAFTEIAPQKRMSKVEITTQDKKSFSETIEYPKGEPENPLSDDELNQKFADLANYAGKNEKQILKTQQAVWHLNGDLKPLFASY